jgi:hypothetical protein
MQFYKEENSKIIEKIKKQITHLRLSMETVDIKLVKAYHLVV